MISISICLLFRGVLIGGNYFAALVGAGLAMGFGAFGSGLGCGWPAASACDAVARNPKRISKTTQAMIIGQAVAQSPSIFALVISIILVMGAASGTQIEIAGIAVGAGLAMGVSAMGSGIGSGRTAGGAVAGLGCWPKSYGVTVRTMLIGQAVCETPAIFGMLVAFIMMFAAAYHMITIVAGTIQKIYHHEFDHKRTQLPRLKDLFDLIHDIKYFLGRAPYRPKMEKFMYKQKAHYLAIIWGNFVLIAAGSVLLFPDIMARLFPETLGKILPLAGADADTYSAFFQDLARLMHADEAVMALILLAFWHWTNVHLVPGRFPIQWTFLTGKITREHQIEEHFLEYINNLKEIPEEREYMKNLLKELEINGSKTLSSADQNASFSQPADAAPGEKT